ncbi:MAG TPA: dihydrofolate reductase family protein [Streptosporangiaceae bacterium]
MAEHDCVFADVMNEIPKVVFSKTLTRAEWAESRIADGDLAEDIDRLKREPGGVILAHGGATFVDALIHDGLIDEYRLVIHPVAIGHGTGLFSALREPLRESRVVLHTMQLKAIAGCRQRWLYQQFRWPAVAHRRAKSLGCGSPEGVYWVGMAMPR